MDFIFLLDRRRRNQKFGRKCLGCYKDEAGCWVAFPRAGEESACQEDFQ